MGSKRKSPDETKSYPRRREFLGNAGKVALGLAAANLSGTGSSSKASPESRGPVLDPDRPVKIGMIGRTGHMYLVFNALDKVQGVEITAYAFEDGDWEYNTDGTKRTGVSYDMESNRKWVERQSWSSSNPKLYETYQEMLDKEKFDVVVAGLPYVRNAHASAYAARAGAHVLCEKPVAVNYPDLEMLAKAVDESGVRLTAMFAMRYARTIYSIRKAVEQGIVGKVCLARGQKSYKFGESRPWFYKHTGIYGSSILWVGIHAIDYIRWTTGLEVRRVGAMHGNLDHPDYPGFQDHSVVNMEFENGATAAVTVDYLRPAKAPTHGDDRLRIIGSSGVLETRELDTAVEVITHDEGPKDLELLKPPSLFADFIGSLRGLNTHLIGPDEPVRVTRICIAATQAANEGRVIEV